MIKHLRNQFLAIVLAVLGLGLGAPATIAAPLTLSSVPLFLSTSVDPNVFFQVDDSGSMDWEVLTRKHWQACAYDTNWPGWTGNGDCNWFIDNGLWAGFANGNTVWYYYVYANTDDAYHATLAHSHCTSGTSKLYSCDPNINNTPYQFDWRILSSSLNVTYFDPSVLYTPWAGPCRTSGTACANANFTTARSNPREGEAGYTLTRDLTGTVYEVWVDDKGYTGPFPRRGTNTNVTNVPNGEVDLWDSHIKYTVNAADVTVETFNYAPDATGLHPTSNTITISGTQTDAYGRTAAQIRQNVANWYSYARRRAFVAKGAVAAVMSNNPGFRYGINTINNQLNFVEVPAAGVTNYTAHNKNLLANLFSLNWPPFGTPLRDGLDRVGRYYDNTDGRVDPIINSCQKNFSVLFTDGFWNGGNPGVGNTDGDGHTNTLADVARRYYLNDLSPLPNELIPDLFDPATYQHMVTFTVAFGVAGNLIDTDADGWPNPPLAENSDWGNPLPSSNSPEKIDDMWHAAYNSRGTFVAAQSPAAVVDSLQAALQNIANRTASAASVALSTGSISASTKVYQARFDSATWAGQLLAYPINPDGSIGSVAWDAGSLIPASRTIITNNGTNGVAFQWANLSVAQQATLNTDITGTTDALGANRLSYLRGSSSNEESGGGPFRNRPAGTLGDIINSAPIYVATPAFRYSDTLESAPYSTFQSTYASRTPMVYAGANDGMLHGFAGDTGIEKLAYVPSKVYNNLSRLTSPNYSHTYYVDGTPTVGDAFISGSWKTVLVGGLNAGGQGIYALNVTDPSSFSEANANSLALWEFTDQDDTDLGNTFSRPNIVRMANSKWAAVFGNGYNNTAADGNASTTGDAALYIVNLETGAIIKKISTKVGTSEDPLSLGRPNALATVTPIDSNGDAVVDTIYAGDLFGNVWKFDVSSSNPNTWRISFGSTANPEPLFTACASATVPCPASDIQPITSRMDVGRGPQGNNIMVYFGTGKYVESGDTSDLSSQTFYGILDNGNQVASRSNLLQQTIMFEAFYATQDGSTPPYKLRVTSDTTMTTQSGWYLDLISPVAGNEGERVVSDPILNSGRIIFTTLIPDTTACSFGGQSWLMELDALSGKRLDITPFDLTGDRDFTNDDLVDIGGGNFVPVSGKQDDEILSTPGILNNGDDGELKYISGSAGNISTTVESTDGPSLGRQSWQQLK